MNTAIDISIVVPTYNRKRSLQRCLVSLFEQDYPGEKFEIIVVDDGFDTGIIKTIEDLRKFHSNLKYFSQYQKGPACARNLGIEVASGNIIGFIDDDCIVHKDWIKLMIQAHLMNPNIVAVGGITFTSTQKTPVLVSQFLSSGSIQTHINGKKETIFFPTCNVSFKKWVLKEHKFDEKFSLPGGEDLELFWYLFKHGHRFIWNKDIKVIHCRDTRLVGFLKQAYIYGRGNLLVQHMHKNHPLLKELKTGKISFWIAALINAIKIPRFSYLLSRRLINESNIHRTCKKLSVYLYFVLHKIFYILGNISEYFRIRKEKLNTERKNYTIPRLLILDITHSCNLSCRICDIWKTADIKKDIDTPYIKRILLQAKELEIENNALSGGEPLLRQDIFEIFDYARRIKIKNLGVLTNGALLEKYMDKLKPYLVDNTISLVISLDSLKPQTHNYIRNSDVAWYKSINSLRSLSSFKKGYSQINFNVITIILNQNLEELLDLAIFIKSLGTNSLQFQTLLPNNLRMAERRNSIFWVPEKRLAILDEVIDRLIEFKEENCRFVKNSSKNLSLMKKYFRGTINSYDVKCTSANLTILISNNGDCTTCFSSYGDIKRRDLKEILKSEEIIKAREKTKKCVWPCLLPCFCNLD